MLFVKRYLTVCYVGEFGKKQIIKYVRQYKDTKQYLKKNQNPECIQRVHKQEKLVIGNNELLYLSIIYNKNNK